MMTAETSTVSYSANLPLAWQDFLPHDENMRARWHYTNLVLLRALASIEAATPVEGEYERDSHLAKTLERLESKIDIALSLIANMSISRAELPQQTSVTLSAQHVEWNDDTPPNAEQDIRLTLYLSPKLPEPLVLVARVVSVTSLNEGFQCVAALLERDEEFVDWMTRTVFRYHRRLLQARHQR